MSYFGRKLVPDLFSDSNRPFSSSKDSHFQNEATSAKPESHLYEIFFA